MTPAGRGTVVVGLAITALGLLSGYAALTTMGATLLISVVIALIFVGRHTDISARRRVRPDRVIMGDPADTELTITNNSRRTMGSSVVHERIGDRYVAIDLPSLDPGESVVIDHRLPTDHRGVFAIGPLTVRRGDPIGLVRRGNETRDQSQLIVHPLIHALSPFPTGVQRDLEGIHSGESAEGGITFSNLREYVPGDDLRLIHWRSSARMDELMVRHNVDVHRPRTSVILDTSIGLYDKESFEDAVRAAASIVAASMLRRFPFTLRTIDGRTIDDRSSRMAVMDFLAMIEPTKDGAFSLGAAALQANRGPTGLSCATITGRTGVETLQSLGPLRHRFAQLTMVRMGTGRGAEVHEIGGAILINADNSTNFARAWNRRMRQ